MNYRNWVVTYFLEVLKCCQKHLIHFTGTKSTITQKNSTDYKQSLASFKRGKSKTGMCHKPLEPVSTCCNFPGACLVCLPKQPYLLVLSIQQPCSRKCWELLTSLALQPINYTTATVAKHSPPKGKKKITLFSTSQNLCPKWKTFKHCFYTKGAGQKAAAGFYLAPVAQPQIH